MAKGIVGSPGWAQPLPPLRADQRDRDSESALDGLLPPARAHSGRKFRHRQGEWNAYDTTQQYYVQYYCGGKSRELRQTCANFNVDVQ